MGKRGPAPQPTATRKLKGNPGRRPYNKFEPKPVNKMPRAPQWMAASAKKQWRVIAKPLHNAGLLTSIDGMALSMLCETYAQYIESKEMVDKSGKWLMSAEGKPYVNPALWVMNKARGELLKWMREFGMTPSARSSINFEPQVEEKELSIADQLMATIQQGK